ncbi:xanthotoxin 5-hydroxylase CYP82C4 [Ricinus communis]|uniref:xanthotoxin 5-hydroxylase CYP82C4 n=1 Tax=Ricinus communis TaxID=3988 RepID=UPI00201B1F6D|nr:xanthotoxin 5-hydroxylase CYP82C4 [Ricinus communis]
MIQRHISEIFLTSILYYVREQLSIYWMLWPLPEIVRLGAWLRGTKRSRGSNVREAPEPAGAWPIIGHLRVLGGADKLLHKTLGLMADKYGPAFNIRIGSHRAFVIASKELAKECLTTNDKAVASRPTTAATERMCYNHAMFGFAPYSSHWREMRKIVMFELLSNRRLEMVKNVQASEVDIGLRKLYNLWADNGCLPVLVELKQWFQDVTFNVIVRMVAGKRYAGSSDDYEARLCQKAISQFYHLMGIFVVSDALPFLWWLDLEGHKKAMKETAKDLDTVLAGWLEEHLQRRVPGEVKTEVEQDFIDVMLSLEEKGNLSGFLYDADISIKATCLALIAGASGTTTTTLIWAISLLLNNQAALKKAQEELDQHIGTERQVDESDLKNLVYLQAIIKETLRLYPVAPLIPREFMEDCTIGGYHVAAGTRLLINVWKIHRDPRFWTNPLAFEPGRFLTSHADIDVRGQHFELIPFGSGRRSCPGAPFGLHALHLALARFLHAFDLATPMDQPIDMSEMPGTHVPKATPLEVLVSPRLPAKLYRCAEV